MEKVGLKDLAPNWESIGKPLKRSLKEAILLSLNTIPDWEKYIKNLPPKSDLDINFDYVHRLQLAIEWALEVNFLVNLKPTKDITENDLVYLSKFANWAITNQNWKMPLEFRALAKSIEVSPIVIVTKSKLPWGLKPLSEIQRMPNYRAVLYQTLKKMYEEGKETVPTAYEVLESWRSEFKNEQPKECKIWVLRTTFEFENKEGKRSIVQVKTLKEAIQRLLITD
jgi:hypothetical protein